MPIDKDELEIAKLAALASGELKRIDASSLGTPAGGPANKLDPRSFISAPTSTAPPVPRHNMKVPGMVTAPVSRPAGTIKGDTVTVNPADLMIPIDGVDEETRKAIERHSAGNIQPEPQQQVAPPKPVPPPNVQVRENETFPTKTVSVDAVEVRKMFGYIKRKIRAIEKNHDIIIKTLKGLTDEKNKKG